MFGRKAKTAALPSASNALSQFIDGFSIEVMPRTAEKIDDFRAILPEGTRIYVAHIEGTPIGDMVATAKRIAGEGFPVMPHLPARIIADEKVLRDWIDRYQGEAGIDQALLLAGGVEKPHGKFHCSMQLMETGLFDKAGFKRLHVAGHPEGNKDIDPDGSDRSVMDALRWKQAFSRRTDANMALATQFCFEAKPVIAWVERLQREGIDLPVHIGIAGPAKLQTMIKFAMTCGVGASLRVLQRRATDVAKLVLPFTPEEILTELAIHKANNPGFGIAQVHFFPLGGITKTAEFTNEFGAARPLSRAASA
jgi:methylenetetrahydrofolate reductase (NADPH)